MMVAIVTEDLAPEADLVTIEVHTYDRRPYRPNPNRAASPPKDEEMEDIEVRLKGLIIKIGDKISPELQVNLNKMKNILDNDYSKYPSTVQETFKACICEIPAKAPVYATLLGLLNVCNHEVVGKLMDEFNGMLQEIIERPDWFRLKQLLRFYGELVNVNVILPTVYCTLINGLLSGLDEPGQLRSRLDCIVYIVLSTLPWSAKELHERNPTDLEQILTKIGAYMQRRGKIERFSILKQYQNNNYALEEDPLVHLWSLIQKLQIDGWEVPVLPKPHKWFDSEFNSALQHDLPQFQLPTHSENVEYIAPQNVLKICVDDDGNSLPSVPDHDSLDYFILSDVITDTIRIFESNRKECAKYLLGISQSFEPGYFRTAPVATENRDNRTDEDASTQESSTWNLSDLMLEILFTQMLKIPSPPFRQVFYSCILTELCRTEGASTPMALGRVVKCLFSRVQYMDSECVYRLWCWFSHHMSNFGFQWDWKSWKHAVELDPNHPQYSFIRETLEKEIRLSYYERIKTSLPEEFLVMIPQEAPGPVFEYKDADHPLYDQARAVIESLRAKKTVEEVRDILDKFNEMQAQQGIDEQTRMRMVRNLFLQCLLLVGSKSFSHVLNVVERYLELMRYVNSTPEGRLHTVQIVASFWKNNSQFLGILLDKLLNYRVIDPTSVITWTFESEQLQNAARSYPWEILKNTLNKVVSRVVQVKMKLENFRSLHQVNEAKRAESPITEMAQAESQQELDTLRIVENSLTSVTREEKEVFMVMYQKFAEVLQEMLSSLDAKNEDPNTNWTYWWVNGWFRETLRLYHMECRGFLTTLEMLVFGPEVDQRVASVFQEIKMLNEAEMFTF
ncbi:Component of the cap-binding complex (CBC) [Apophysomyces sp. BC1034]|nr:Component of the cap-binding complex (CBC) [Apophysomyces sp. BC1034]